MKHYIVSIALLLSAPLIAQQAAQYKLSGILNVEVSAGELIDKATILQIKAARITDPIKLEFVHKELQILEESITRIIPLSQELNNLRQQLLFVNIKLWEIEDKIREKEAKREFDAEFIELARSVYYTNDLRGTLKSKINALVGSPLMEQKKYTEY